MHSIRGIPIYINVLFSHTRAHAHAYTHTLLYKYECIYLLCYIFLVKKLVINMLSRSFSQTTKNHYVRFEDCIAYRKIKKEDIHT